MTKSESNIKRTVYSIKNIKNGKMYIGITKNLRQRITTHFSKLRNNKHPNPKLQSDFSIYGEDYFKVKTLFESTHYGETFNMEKKLIRKYNTICNGYNIAGEESMWDKKTFFSTTVDGIIGKKLIKHINEKEASRSDWFREAIIEKAKGEGII